MIGDKAPMCSQCKERRSAHSIGQAKGWTYLCCACFVRAGNPPADWHPLCMATAAGGPAMSALTGPMRRALRAFNPADTECRTSPGAIPHGTIKALRSRGLLTVPGFDLTEKGRMEAERARQRVIGG